MDAVSMLCYVMYPAVYGYWLLMQIKPAKLHTSVHDAAVMWQCPALKK